MSLVAPSEADVVPREGAAGCAVDADAHEAGACLHCGQPLPSAVKEARADFCCFGCRTVYHALGAAGLDRFYDLRGARGEPVGDLELERRDYTWLEPLERAVAEASAGGTTVRLRVQGIRCAACVWVIESLFARVPGGLRALVNPALGTLELSIAVSFDLRGYVEQVERCGYRLAVLDDAAAPARGDEALLLRFGICAALALNAMAFGAAIHLGLSRGPLYELLHGLSYGAAALSVLIGGPVFFSAARAALARGVLHLDVPIALGIGLTFAAASVAYFGGYPQAAYFDSLAVFIALMLGGRYLQERAITRNRRELLDDPGLENLIARRVEADRLVSVRYGQLRRGDVLLLAPGDLLPVEGELLTDRGSCSLDWISGEPEPRMFSASESIPAGAFNAGARPLRVRLAADYASSALLPIVGASGVEQAAAGRLRRFSTAYVLGVLALAALGLAYYAWLLGDPLRGLSVATAVCVVTCPCAIGIAVPLAYELAHAALRRRGLFVRSASFLERARGVRRVVFDKTGTLTTGKLKLCDPEALLTLSECERQALYDLAVSSLHPKSVAVRRALEERGARYRADVVAQEHPGEGLELVVDAQRYRLGRASFVCDRAQPGQEPEQETGQETGQEAGEELAFSVDGVLRLCIPTAESDRPDAASEIAALSRAGYEVFVLSGDAPERVAAAAARLGLPQARALGGMSPEAKAGFLRRLAQQDGERDSLMIGDGINDAPAVREARCSGTPAIDRALLPARTDFYFTTPGLGPVSAALLAARDVSAIVRHTLALAVAYNVVAVALALGGLMQPWLAAVLMPASSIATVARTASLVAHRSRAWKC